MNGIDNEPGQIVASSNQRNSGKRNEAQLRSCTHGGSRYCRHIAALSHAASDGFHVDSSGTPVMRMPAHETL